MKTIAWLLTLALLSGPGASAQSLNFSSQNTSSSVEDQIRTFITDYNRYRDEQRARDRKKSDPNNDSTDQFMQMRDQALADLILLQQPDNERAADALSQRLARLEGDGTYLGNKTLSARRILQAGAEPGNVAVSVAEMAFTAMLPSTYLPPERHNFILAPLLTDYLERPQDRAAIDTLIQAWDPLVEEEIKASYSDPLTEWVQWGMEWVWMAVVLWDWRGGAKGLAEDGGKILSMLNRGGDALLTNARGLKDVFIDFTGAGSRITRLGLADVEAEESSEAVAAMVKSPGSLREQAAQVGKEVLSLVTKNPKEPLEKPTKLNQLQRHAWQLARTLAISGVHSWSLESETKKIPPAAALQAVQAFAVQRLQIAVAQLRASVAAFNTKLASGADASSLKPEHEALHKNYDSLKDECDDLASSKTASIYMSDLPWPDLDQRAKELAKKNWFQTRRLPMDQRFLQFAEEHRELNQLLHEIQGEINRAKKDAGYNESDQLSFGLTAVKMNLQWIGEDLDKGALDPIAQSRLLQSNSSTPTQP